MASIDLDEDDDIFDKEMEDLEYYINLPNFPVQLIAMEKLNLTLDELLKNILIIFLQI